MQTSVINYILNKTCLCSLLKFPMQIPEIEAWNTLLAELHSPS